jgi:transcriptional regulator GlxA family with amidase domain
MTAPFERADREVPMGWSALRIERRTAGGSSFVHGARSSVRLRGGRGNDTRSSDLVIEGWDARPGRLPPPFRRSNMETVDERVAPPATAAFGAAPSAPRRVVVVAFDGVRFLDVVGPLEVFTVANEEGDHYAARIATPGGRDVVTTTGTRLGADVALEDLADDDIDTLLVAGTPNWALMLAPEITRGVARLATSSRRIVSVCTGTFALAGAGLMDGRRAATHWRHAAALADLFPSTTVDPEALFVRDGNVFSSAGIAAGIDLALALVEDDLGAEAARRVAKVLVVFLQRPGGQSQFSPWTSARFVRNDQLRFALDAIALDPAGDHSLEAMAARASFSPRHLARLFDEQVGMTPARYVERVRIEAARTMLETGDEALAVVAKQSGFRSQETMRRAFLRELGVSPGAYRSSFRTTGIATHQRAVGDTHASPERFHRVPVSPPPP